MKVINILAVDTSSSNCSIAIISKGLVIDGDLIEKKNKQAELLLVSIEKLLKKNNISYNDFDAFVVTKGPGSFIGVRIGISAMQGVSLVVDKPLYGISTLEIVAFILAKNNEKKLNLCPIIDAGRDYVYYQEFSNDLLPIMAPDIVKKSDLKKNEMLLTNDFHIISDAKNAGLLAFYKKKKENLNNMSVKPVYIR
ncbi:MAG: tRNA (adenosine(37)-N6)-threonylcarbamoyltransferase complex dimerization subunit type 1 TsaB [Rickettsiaceae bacterium H1]|nr:tRNA (adenosine(37)-N6)-threonylcarbamoyltransferase complex dimerization subunit type 1 TsaB [Rickettsiaceae bacterium H1]